MNSGVFQSLVTQHVVVMVEGGVAPSDITRVRPRLSARPGQSATGTPPRRPTIVTHHLHTSTPHILIGLYYSRHITPSRRTFRSVVCCQSCGDQTQRYRFSRLLARSKVKIIYVCNELNYLG